MPPLSDDMNYDELLARLTSDLPNVLPGFVPSSLNGSSGSVPAPTSKSVLTWDPSELLFVPQRLTSDAVVGNWVSYTPVVTANSGAITSYTATGKYQKVNSGLGAFQFTVNLTNVGTASSYMQIMLPSNFSWSGLESSCLAFENGSTGAQAFCIAFYSVIQMNPTFLTSASSVWVNGYNWVGLILIPGTWS